MGLFDGMVGSINQNIQTPAIPPQNQGFLSDFARGWLATRTPEQQQAYMALATQKGMQAAAQAAPPGQGQAAANAYLQQNNPSAYQAALQQQNTTQQGQLGNMMTQQDLAAKQFAMNQQAIMALGNVANTILSQPPQNQQKVYASMLPLIRQYAPNAPDQFDPDQAKQMLTLSSSMAVNGLGAATGQGSNEIAQNLYLSNAFKNLGDQGTASAIRQKTLPGSESPANPQDAAVTQMLKAGQETAQQVTGMLLDSKGNVNRSTILNMNANTPWSNGRLARANMDETIAAIARAQGSPRLSPAQLDAARARLMPSPLDDDNTVKLKINLFNKFVNGDLNLIDPSGNFNTAKYNKVWGQTGGSPAAIDPAHIQAVQTQLDKSSNISAFSDDQAAKIKAMSPQDLATARQQAIASGKSPDQIKQMDMEISRVRGENGVDNNPDVKAAQEIGKLAPKADPNLVTGLIDNAGILGKYGLNTPQRLQQFAAQVTHETAGLTTLTENISDKKANAQYGGRLGNDQPGDGALYKGRGYIQLTGKANYQKYGDEIGVDLVNKPQLAADPKVAVQVAAAYWNDHGLNQLADQGDVKGITKAINGGYNGLGNRTNLANKAAKMNLFGNIMPPTQAPQMQAPAQPPMNNSLAMNANNLQGNA